MDNIVIEHEQCNLNIEKVRFPVNDKKVYVCDIVAYSRPAT